MNIGDKSGSGQDHCELVGGSEANAIVARRYTTSLTLKGYYRSYMAGEFSFGWIGYYNGILLNSYIECGVSIPGTNTVV
uniref:Target of Nesh-SH3/FNDC1 C-terminal domain-containing protein n=1 Tax=Magallana gigas TaxID=29159 RepID=A0A8W8JA53_MAGGI